MKSEKTSGSRVARLMQSVAERGKGSEAKAGVGEAKTGEAKTGEAKLGESEFTAGSAGVTTTTTTTTAASKARGAVHVGLRIGAGGAGKTAPKTTGARMSLVGFAKIGGLGRFGAVAKEVARQAVIAAVLGLALASGANIKDVTAQTVYVNVNGATVNSAEYKGAQQAAREHHEPFIAVSPAQLEKTLADFESGKLAPGTLRKFVPSGHSSGQWFSGVNGSLGFTDVQQLAQKYPKAFAQVQLFFPMACNVGTEENSRAWLALFPNAHALVGFDHIGPASDRPAAGAVLTLVDRELGKVDWKGLTADKAMALAQRLSTLPGVGETEFAIRLRTNDGNSVYFSKLNKPTSLSQAQDLVDQLRPTNFEPYKTGAAALGPNAHEGMNPVRAFYNASQDLLNALGRDLAARNASPDVDANYQRALSEKEGALELIYMDVLLGNVEAHMRPQLDQAGKELGMSIPKLGTLTRPQIIELAKQVQQAPLATLQGFAHKNAADIDLVQAALSQKQGMGAVMLAALNEHTSASRAESALVQLGGLTGAPASDVSPEVKAAAERLAAALSAARSPVVDEVRRVLDEGLVQLKGGVFPPDWITTAATPPPRS